MSGRALKNPGSGAPEVLDFDELPSLSEFLRNGGVPGVEYLYLLPQEQPKAQREGWATIVNMPFFRVRGVDMCAMARGTPIPGAVPGSSVCKLSLSVLAREATAEIGVLDDNIEPVETTLKGPDAVLEKALRRVAQPTPAS